MITIKQGDCLELIKNINETVIEYYNKVSNIEKIIEQFENSEKIKQKAKKESIETGKTYLDCLIEELQKLMKG